MKPTDYILNLVMSIIECNDDILALVDIDDIIIQRDVLISVLVCEDMSQYKKGDLHNITDLIAYMDELNSQVDEFIKQRMYIRELCNKI